MLIRSLIFSFIVIMVAMTGPLIAYLQSNAQRFDTLFDLAWSTPVQAQNHNQKSFAQPESTIPVEIETPIPTGP